jgi:hypothetical protein
MVWCIRTTTGCFVARRSGKVFVTGNSGYKKGLDIKKTLLDEGFPNEAEKWVGHHTGLKPAIEEWVLIRKPLEGTVIENILKHGVGALNIDASRVFTDWEEADRPDTWKKSGHSAKPEATKVAAPPGNGINCHPLGRYPAAAELGFGFLGIEKDEKTWLVLQNRVSNVLRRIEKLREEHAVFDAMLELESE